MKNHITFSLRIGVAIPFVYFSSIVIAGLFYPGYNHARQFASELGAAGAPHPWIFNTGLGLTGAFQMIAAFGFWRAFHNAKLNPILGGIAAATLCCSGLAGMISAYFPMPGPRHGG